LVDAYEQQHWRIDAPDAIDAIVLRTDERGLTRADLEPILGLGGRVSEMLNHKRSLSLEMMRRWHTELGIPAKSFMRPPKRDDALTSLA